MNTQTQQNKKRVTILFDEDQYQEINRYTSSYGISISDFLRYNGFKAIRSDKTYFPHPILKNDRAEYEKDEVLPGEFDNGQDLINEILN